MHASAMTIAYGMTETAPASTLTRIDDPLEIRVSTVGSALPHTEIKIADPETQAAVLRGERGEICTRGYLVMRGYWDDEEATHRAVVNGWMRTGDLVHHGRRGTRERGGPVDGHGDQGRGEHLPREIEELLFTHTSVESVQIVGVPDERLGEELAAFVIAVPGAGVTDDEIRDFCRERLAGSRCRATCSGWRSSP